MPQAKFFNKGILRGTVTRSEMVEFEGKTGKQKFLSMEVNTDGGTNRVKSILFSTKANPTKAADLHMEYPVGSKVEVTGKIGEREFESRNGNKGIDRSLSANSIREMKADAKPGATFIYHGIVEKIVEKDGGANVTVRYDETYTPANSNESVTRSDTVTLFTEDEDLIYSISKGFNVKFKGKILNRLEFDDYGDVIDNIQMYKLEVIEDIVDKDDIVMPEKLDFI